MAGFSDDEKAVAIVQQCPGIELKRFVIRMGWVLNRRTDQTHPNTSISLSAEADRGLNELVERGVIEIKQPNAIRTEATVYLPGTIPPDNAPPKRERGYRQFPCRTYIDPTVTGAWRKPPSKSAQEQEQMSNGYERLMDVIADMKQRQVIWTRSDVCGRADVVDNYMAPTSQAYRAAEAREAYEAAVQEIKTVLNEPDSAELQQQRFDTIMHAIAQMKESGKELSRRNICLQAGVRHSYLDGGRDSQWCQKAREAYDEAILAIKAKQQGKAIAPPDTTALQQELEELRRQNEALRARPPQIVQGGAQFLVQEAAHWRQEVTRLERELEEARANLGACDRLLGVHGMEQGANGNGCLVKVTA